MPEVSEKAAREGLGLADAIAVLPDELLKAQAAGANAEIQLPISSMTVQPTVHPTREAGNKAGLRVPVIGVELGGGASLVHGSEHAVTVLFDDPVDRQGRPVRVVSGSDRRKG